MIEPVTEKSDVVDDVIETDKDTLQEDEGEEGLYPYDPTKSDIDIREDPQTVFELMRKHANGKLIIDPEFQRNPKIWNLTQKSEFIESIILNFPLPPFYVSQTVDGKYIIVDGLQRTSTLRGFVNDGFKLSGLKALKNLNTYSFSELKTLSGDYQTKIEDKKLNFYVIRPSVPIKVVYDIFKRINTGGTNLERQEVRNCIFLGRSTKLLKELSELDSFKLAINYGISAIRMKDREVVLRYLAFKIFGYKDEYKGDMSGFLERAMKKINLMDDIAIKSLKTDFVRVMELTFDFFREQNFRLPTSRSRGPINIAIFESVSYFFSINPDTFLLEYQEAIRENFKKLLTNDEYLDKVRYSTSIKAKVSDRFEIAQKILGDV
jgi:hypothetical protein